MRHFTPRGNITNPTSLISISQPQQFSTPQTYLYFTNLMRHFQYHSIRHSLYHDPNESHLKITNPTGLNTTNSTRLIWITPSTTRHLLLIPLAIFSPTRALARNHSPFPFPTNRHPTPTGSWHAAAATSCENEDIQMTRYVCVIQMSLVEAFHSNIEMRLVGFVMLPLGVKCRVAGMGLFCKRALWKRQYSAKETYNFTRWVGDIDETCWVRDFENASLNDIENASLSSWRSDETYWVYEFEMRLVGFVI